MTSACLGTENVAVDGVGRFDNWRPTAWLIRDLQLSVDDRLWIRRLRQPEYAADYRIVQAMSRASDIEGAYEIWLQNILNTR